MFAPRRVPPCLIVSVARSKTRMNEIGPLEMPVVLITTSLAGRSRENEKPVPPPDLWISAVNLTASKMSSIESSTGSTKQAESWPQLAPGVHQRRRVGQELQVRHQVVEGLRERLGVGGGVEERLGAGDHPGDPVEHVSRGLDRFALEALLQVALLEDREGVAGERRDHCTGYRRRHAADSPSKTKDPCRYPNPISPGALPLPYVVDGRTLVTRYSRVKGIAFEVRRSARGVGSISGMAAECCGIDKRGPSWEIQEGRGAPGPLRGQPLDGDVCRCKRTAFSFPGSAVPPARGCRLRRTVAPDGRDCPGELLCGFAGEDGRAVVDLSSIGYLDGAGTAVLLEVDHALRGSGRKLEITGADAAAAGILALVDWEELVRPPERPRRARGSALAQVGGAALELAAEARHQLAFVGALAISFARGPGAPPHALGRDLPARGDLGRRRGPDRRARSRRCSG